MARVRLWENVGFDGRFSDVDADIAFFDILGHSLNGGIAYSSIQINVEQWILFGDTQKPGADDDDNVLVVYGPHAIPDLTQITKFDNQLAPLGSNGNWNDKISRVQFMAVNPDGIDFKGHDPTIIADRATVFEHGNLGGNSESLWPGRGNLSMNDATSSVSVPAGFLLTLFGDANGGGRAYDFPAGNHLSVPPEFNDQASSYWLRRN